MEQVPIFRKTAGANRRQSEWAKTLRYICARLIDNGLGGILIFGATIVAIVAVMANGMTSADRKAVMIAVLGWPFFAILGWILAFAVFFVCRYTHTLRDKTHEDEMKRVATVKNEAVQAALPFELKSSEEPLKE